MQTSENAMIDKKKSGFEKADKSGHVGKMPAALAEVISRGRSGLRPPPARDAKALGRSVAGPAPATASG